MLTEEQLIRTQELFTAAVSYNTCLHAAFVSEDDMIETDLYYNGKTERVSIPTYHYLLRTVEKLAWLLNVYRTLSWKKLYSLTVFLTHSAALR
jgi:hypothetical protein